MKKYFVAKIARITNSEMQTFFFKGRIDQPIILYKYIPGQKCTYFQTESSSYGVGVEKSQFFLKNSKMTLPENRDLRSILINNCVCKFRVFLSQFLIYWQPMALRRFSV